MRMLNSLRILTLAAIVGISTQARSDVAEIGGISTQSQSEEADYGGISTQQKSDVADFGGNSSQSQSDVYGKFYENLPVDVKRPTIARIPARTVDLTAFGAVGDGRTLCTEAFRKAIQQLSAQGGGRLHVPAGVWLTGPIELESAVELHLDHEAIIYFSPDKRLYLPTEAQQKVWGKSRVLPCLFASRKHDIAITGRGVIDGNGQQWRPVKRGKVSDTEWWYIKQMGGIERQDGKLWYPWQMTSGMPDIKDSPEAQEKMRNDLLRIVDCERVFLEGVTFQNAPKFHVHPCYTEDVVMDGITVRCPWNAQNGDAIDISDCHRVLIVNSTVDAGDDGLCMKSGKPRKSSNISGVEDVVIDGCAVFHAHGGFVLGSETASGMRRIVVRNCRFSGTETGLRFKSGLGRGGRTEQLFVQNIMMTDILQEAVVFQCDYVDRPAGSDPQSVPVFSDEEKRWAPEFQDIHISDIICRGAMTGIKAGGILGLNCIHDIDISNTTIIYTKTDKAIDERTAAVRLTNVTLQKE